MSYLITLKNVILEQNPKMPEQELKDALWEYGEQVTNVRVDTALLAKQRYQRETPKGLQTAEHLLQQQNLAMMTAQEIEMHDILSDLISKL